MQTSSFFQYKGVKGISVALSVPKGIEVYGTYPALYPTWNIVNQYKKDYNQQLYTISYNKILAQLNAEEIYEDLKEYTILCWEKSGNFCHRRLIAKWLETELNISIPEI